MRRLVERDDREWAIQLEKYPTARQSLLEADKELADLLRSRERAAEADERSSSIFLQRQSLGTDNGLHRWLCHPWCWRSCPDSIKSVCRREERQANRVSVVLVWRIRWSCAAARRRGRA